MKDKYDIKMECNKKLDLLKEMESIEALLYNKCFRTYVIYEYSGFSNVVYYGKHKVEININKELVKKTLEKRLIEIKNELGIK
jgi:hypothetical protein